MPCVVTTSWSLFGRHTAFAISNSTWNVVVEPSEASMIVTCPDGSPLRARANRSPVGDQSNQAISGAGPASCRRPVPSAFATNSAAGLPGVRRSKANRVPSFENHGFDSSSGLSISVVVVPVPGSAETIRPSTVLNTIEPLRARPNGSGSRDVEPIRRAAPTRAAMRMARVARMAIARHGTGRIGLGAGEDAHREPPFKGRPGGPLPIRRGLPEHVVEVVGDPRRRELGHELRDLALEALEGRHANCPFGTGAFSGSMSASVERMSPIDRWRRDFAVPSGIPSVAAISGSSRSK